MVAPDSPSAPWPPSAWAAYLSAELGGRVEVQYGRSRCVPVQSRTVTAAGRGPRLELRLHHMFAAAPPEVRAALARWLRVGRRAPAACHCLDRWIQEALDALPARERRPARLQPRGRHHHLDALAEGLFEHTFATDFPSLDVRPGLTWGRRTKSRGRRSLRLGSYDVEGSIVRVHPVLDQAGIPDWFVRFVLMHEILHAVHPPRDVGGRWIHHGPEFRKREGAYPDYQRALRWERENLDELLRAARSGKAFRPRTPVVEVARPAAVAATTAAPIPTRVLVRRQLELFP